jgi:hypothetical protein
MGMQMVAQVLALELDMGQSTDTGQATDMGMAMAQAEAIARLYLTSPMAQALSRPTAAINSATDAAVLFDLIAMPVKKAFN